MVHELLLALTLAAPLAAQQPALSPFAGDKDLCAYLKDVEAKTDADCAADALAALKSAEPAVYSQTLDLARKRKADVLKAYEVLKAPSVAGKEQAPLPQLAPPLNERTFPSWIGPESKGVYAGWLQAENQRLRQEKNNPVSPERKKEIAAAVAANQSRIAALENLTDSAALSCALGESCGARPASTDPAPPGAMPSRGGWTADDFAKANAQERNKKLVPGRMLDRGIPTLGGIASQVVANAPLGPLTEQSKDKKPIDPLAAAGTLALTLSGGLLLFGGLGGPMLEKTFPGIRKGMATGAILLGISGTGAVALSEVSIPSLTLGSSTPQFALAGGGTFGGSSSVISMGDAVTGALKAGTLLAGAKLAWDGITYAKASSQTGNGDDAGGRKIPTDQELEQAANSPDPADKGEKYTKAGRSLMKHNEFSRPGSQLPQPKGNPEAINNAGRQLVEDILKDPARTERFRDSGRFGEILEIRRADGVGVRFGPNNEFLHFIE